MRSALLGTVLAIACSLASAGVPALADGPVIAVIDSGIRADHDAFVPGQVVAWHDFTNDAPRPLARWDSLVATPYDDHGHGTGVAAMAAGLPLDGVTPSHAPGTRLAIARVLSADGASWADVAAGVRWAVDVAGADVVTVSVYSWAIVVGEPVVDVAEDVHAAFAHARERGVLVTLLAGNGFANSGVAPTPSWMHPPVSSNDALIVGGAEPDGSPAATSTRERTGLDPEVTSLRRVVVPCPSSTSCTRGAWGSSYSAPLVAGMAARVLQEAWSTEREGFDVGDLEDALKHAARDTPAPPTAEGYGFLDAAALERALAVVRGDAPSSEPAPVTRAYVEDVQPALRDAWRG